jgi:hypothetical protein
MPSTEKHPSVFAAVLEWCRDHLRAHTAPLSSGPGLLHTVEYASASSAGEMPPPAYNVFNGGLLLRCMDMLQIDRNELAKDDPLLFRELQGRCALCRDRETCERELAHEFDDADWDEWRAYCPSSATLTTIGAVQNCARVAQHLRMRRPTEKPTANCCPRGRISRLPT